MVVNGVMLAAMLCVVFAQLGAVNANCATDPELDLCDAPETSWATMMHSSWNICFAVPMLLAFSRKGSSKDATFMLVALALLASAVPRSSAQVTCTDLKNQYNDEACCGNPSKVLDTQPAACPYNFAKPACTVAEPQSPRDLTAGASGNKVPKAAVLTDAQVNFLPLTNVHFHLGAEHKSEAYSDGSDAAAYDASHARRLAAGAEVRPGYMCPTASLSSTQLASYNFQYCRGQVEVGKSYEIHYVHSSAGYHASEIVDASQDAMDDGLGGAANGRGQLNPMVAVQGQVYQIVNGAAAVDDLLHGWTVVGHTDSVMYAGSTTGPSHNNEICSPYAITWHVDKACHQVPPESFDNLCRQMSELYQLENDLYPHGSRMIVAPAFVVESQYVTPLA